MKLSFWDILASMVVLGGMAVATIFTSIFLNPHTVINPFPPATPVVTLALPTSTSSPQSLPEIWTATPENINGKNVVLVRPTETIAQTGTVLVLPSRTPTRTRTASPSPSKSVTGTPNRTLTASGNKTATKTATFQSKTIAPATQASAQTLCSTTSGYCDDAYDSVVYTGTWSGYAGSGPYKSTDHYSGVAGSTASFTFTGTKISYVFPTFSNRGHARITIDGSEVAVLNLYSSSLTWQQLWDSAPLTNASHIITITVLDGTVDLDAFIINRTGPAITSTPVSTSTPTNTSTFTPTATATRTFTPTPTQVAPPTNISISSNSVAENMISGSMVGSVVTTDPDGGTPFTYSFSTEGCAGPDNDLFDFSGSNLVTNEVFDYETKNIYNICVRTTDMGGATFEKQFTITINDVNEAPYDIEFSTSPIFQDEPIGTAVGDLSTKDVDESDTFTYSLVNGGGSCAGTDNNNFSISGNRLSSNIVFGAPGTYSVCVQSSDSGSLTTNKAFAISIQPLP